MCIRVEGEVREIGVRRRVGLSDFWSALLPSSLELGKVQRECYALLHNTMTLPYPHVLLWRTSYTRVKEPRYTCWQGLLRRAYVSPV